MAISADPAASAAAELHELREENRTLYGVIKLVSSSLELAPMLQGVVDLATEATGCHACFIYLLEGSRLTIRAASPVFGEAVGNVQFSVNEGLTGWVARHRTPEFIRDRAMDDPRMKFVPLLQEQRFQSMVAVPILSRAGETIGVIVLHTEAPHEFAEGTLKLLVHIASLVSGAIENAQLYDQERRRVGRVDRPVGARPAGRRRDRCRGARCDRGRRLGEAARGRRLPAVPSRRQTASRCSCWRRSPRSLPPPSVSSASDLMLDRARGPRSASQAAKALWPSVRGRGPAGDAARRRRRARRAAVRRLVFAAGVRRRGRRDRAGDRASRGGRRSSAPS